MQRPCQKALVLHLEALKIELGQNAGNVRVLCVTEKYLVRVLFDDAGDQFCSDTLTATALIHGEAGNQAVTDERYATERDAEADSRCCRARKTLSWPPS